MALATKQTQRFKIGIATEAQPAGTVVYLPLIFPVLKIRAAFHASSELCQIVASWETRTAREAASVAMNTRAPAPQSLQR